MNTRNFLWPAFAVLTGCATPNIEGEVLALQEAVEQAAMPLNATLAAEADAERLAARNRAIAAGEIVYRDPVDCAFIGDGIRDGIAPTNCQLDPVYSVDTGPNSAIFAMEALAVVESYAASVVALSGSEVSAEIQANLTGFLGSANAFAAATESDAVLNPNQIAPVSRIASSLADQARVRALRRLVNEADEPLSGALDYLVARQDSTEGLTDAAERLVFSYQAVRASRRGETSDYLAAVLAYEAEIERFRTTANDTTYARLLLVWRTHEQLRINLRNRRIDFDALASIIEDIQSF